MAEELDLTSAEAESRGASLIEVEEMASAKAESPGSTSGTAGASELAMTEVEAPGSSSGTVEGSLTRQGPMVRSKILTMKEQMAILDIIDR